MTSIHVKLRLPC